MRAKLRAARHVDSPAKVMRAVLACVCEKKLGVALYAGVFYLLAGMLKNLIERFGVDV